MKHILEFEKYDNVTEGFWDDIFGRPKATGDISKGTVLRGQGWSQTGKDRSTEDTEDYYIVFQGQKFYDDDVEYDDYYSSKPLPRIERGKLIIANPAWKL